MIWRRRQAPGAVPLAVLVSAVSLWSLAYMFSLAGTTLAAQLFWVNLALVGIVLVPGSWLAFALIYSGQGGWLTRSRLLLLTIMPLTSLAAAWTNEQHHLFRSGVYLVNSGSFVVLETTFGPLFWIHTAYSYLLLLLGSLLLARSLFRMSPSYRRQASGLIIGLITTWAGNAIYLSGLSPFPHLDLTPFALGISGLALTWDLLRFGLFELVPIAYGTVFQSMDDAVIVLDGRDKVVEINPAALALIRRESREVIGHPVERVFAGQAEMIARYRQVSDVCEELVFGTAPDDRSFELRISPIFDRSAQINGRVIVLRDSTERRRAAMALQRQNEDLAAFASENARLYSAVQQELAERKQTEVSLSLAKEAAEVANRAKSRFLGNMSHELRTPLSAILGYAELLKISARKQGSQDLVNDIEHIQVAGQHLLSLISDVLDITRIEAEKLDLHLEYFDIATLVRDVEVTIMPLVQKNGNTFHVDCPSDSGMMYADSTRMRQVLLNVLDNAAKFTEHGQIRLRAGIEAATARSGTAPLESGQPVVALFQISDTGIGISPEQQRDLFKEFVQIDDSPTRKYGGSGLGLVISYRLCHLMGGTIAVTSTLGQGSTFTIELPLPVRMAGPTH
ncbi:PAS domain-containing protein [Chloroflexales bacterium ZM16-3]|nr:PAS domain-containing protein [Chloroflexales bacterium ZM16-3]